MHMPGFGCFLIGQVYEEEILKNPGPQCGFSHRCGCFLLPGKSRMESVVEGFPLGSHGLQCHCHSLHFYQWLTAGHGPHMPQKRGYSRDSTGCLWFRLLPQDQLSTTQGDS